MSKSVFVFIFTKETGCKESERAAKWKMYYNRQKFFNYKKVVCCCCIVVASFIRLFVSCCICALSFQVLWLCNMQLKILQQQLLQHDYECKLHKMLTVNKLFWVRFFFWLLLYLKLKEIRQTECRVGDLQGVLKMCSNIFDFDLGFYWKKFQYFSQKFFFFLFDFWN